MIIVKVTGKATGKGVLVTEFMDEALQYISSVISNTTDIVIEVRPADMGTNARVEDRVRSEGLDC